ncbi:transporter [Luedemannella flava]
MLILLNFVPFAIGAFLGAPMLARELESGTWQLAWTQSVPRARWLAVKLAALGALTVALNAAFAALVGWYRQPFDLFGRFLIDGFDVSGIAPLGYGLFAFALATAAGALLRRSLPALGAALVVFVAVRVAVAGWVRPHYRAPVTLVEDIPAGSGEVRTGTADLRDGIISQGVVDPAGRHLSDLEGAMVQHKAMAAGLDPTTVLHDEGYHRWVTYQPTGRFWSFQLIEAGLFAGLAALLLVVVVRRVRRL